MEEFRASTHKALVPFVMGVLDDYHYLKKEELAAATDVRTEEFMAATTRAAAQLVVDELEKLKRETMQPQREGAHFTSSNTAEYANQLAEEVDRRIARYQGIIGEAAYKQRYLDAQDGHEGTASTDPVTDLLRDFSAEQNRD